MTDNGLTEYLLLIQEQTLRVSVLALVIYLLKFRRIDSFVTVLLLMCVMDITHMLTDDTILSWYETNPELAKHSWYLFFAITDFLFVFAAFKICDRIGVRVNKASRTIIFSYIALGFVQLGRYADRILIETDMLGGLYSLAIPAVNSGVTITVFLFAVYTVFLYSGDKSWS